MLIEATSTTPVDLAGTLSGATNVGPTLAGGNPTGWVFNGIGPPDVNPPLGGTVTEVVRGGSYDEVLTGGLVTEYQRGGSVDESIRSGIHDESLTGGEVL